MFFLWKFVKVCYMVLKFVLGRSQLWKVPISNWCYQLFWAQFYQLKKTFVPYFCNKEKNETLHQWSPNSSSRARKIILVIAVTKPCCSSPWPSSVVPDCCRISSQGAASPRNWQYAAEVAPRYEAMGRSSAQKGGCAASPLPQHIQNDYSGRSQATVWRLLLYMNKCMCAANTYGGQLAWSVGGVKTDG